jgi:long-chain-fatty-acid--CoA ligase ACSBG
MPKAVMTSHDNYIFEIDTLIEHFAMDRPSLYGKGRVLSYLPLSHAAAQLVDLLVPIRCGYNVFFPDSTVLTTGLLKFLSISRP